MAANANPAVCRIMDYGKFRFDAAQRAKESRRKTTQTQIKEMKYRVKIGPGDFDTKTRKVLEFLHEGHKVKITIMFRGRETAHPHLGKLILDRIADQAASFAKVEAAPKLDGRNMIMVLAPDRRAQQQQQAKAGRQPEPGDADVDASADATEQAEPQAQPQPQRASAPQGNGAPNGAPAPAPAQAPPAPQEAAAAPAGAADSSEHHEET